MYVYFAYVYQSLSLSLFLYVTEWPLTLAARTTPGSHLDHPPPVSKLYGGSEPVCNARIGGNHLSNTTCLTRLSSAVAHNAANSISRKIA